MVAIIHAGRSIRNALHYNENKQRIFVDKRKTLKAAELIHSVGFARDTQHLGITEKLKTFERLIERNQRSKINSVHISLNFDPSEHTLATSTLQKIADGYMEKIGFASQPYLVYKHNDSAHPHIHIISTNIKKDGKRISLHNIGRNQSETARKELEQEFTLVAAEQKKRQVLPKIQPIDLEKIIYGPASKQGIKKAIANVLNRVISEYKYTSLAELNAVLSLYNIVADPGSLESRIFKNGGLVYRAINSKGKKLGAPIPASAIPSRPTMAVLKEKFQVNEKIRLPHKIRIREAVDQACMSERKPTMRQLSNTLRRQNIILVARQNAAGQIYGLTYVDRYTKTVFNGSDLGKPYSANQLLARCSPEHNNVPQYQQEQTPSSVQYQIQFPNIGLSQHSESSLAAELRQDYRAKRKKRPKH